MKTSSIPLTLSIAILAASLGCEPSENNPASQNIVQNEQESADVQISLMREELDIITADSLSSDEGDALVFMREEEKLARDMYLQMETKWNLRPFTNIQGSEQTHMSALLYLIERYGLNDPVGANGVGQFTDTSLRNLYNDLLLKGNTSANDAITVGAIIEEVDIIDLQHRSLATDNQDINYVYEQLMRGSRNHLRSFTANLRFRGITFVPHYLPQEEYDLIIAGGQETGRTRRPSGR